VVAGPLPARGVVYEDAAEAVVFFASTYSHNFGHLIPDELAGIYRLLGELDAQELMFVNIPYATMLMFVLNVSIYI
jgi:hypothetical protein